MNCKICKQELTTEEYHQYGARCFQHYPAIVDVHELQARAYEHGQDDAIQGIKHKVNPYQDHDWTVKNAYYRGRNDPEVLPYGGYYDLNIED